MGEHTEIGWTDHTFNPWIGCARVSAGCLHCYAETLTKRTGMAVWGVDGTRTRTSVAYWGQPLRWNRQAEAAGVPALVFCASLADVFEDRPDLEEPRSDLFDLIDRTPHLIWQLLTKRPQNIAPMTPYRWRHGLPPNVWVGTTVEDQRAADERVPVLREVPAVVRFLSCEPLLGPIDLHDYLSRAGTDWVIVGGESGAGFRAMDVDHARSLRDQCRLWGVPLFFKQVGGFRPTAGGDELDGQRHKQFPAQAQR